MGPYYELLQKIWMSRMTATAITLWPTLKEIQCKGWEVYFTSIGSNSFAASPKPTLYAFCSSPILYKLTNPGIFFYFEPLLKKILIYMQSKEGPAGGEPV